ncbi:Dabb family protein [candidate division KSB1 bacterium]|nr:Dabb family protein [candidate division KSB1 bacterium]
MIVHIVMWKLHEFADGADKAANAQRVKAVLIPLRGQIAGLTRLDVGINVPPDAQAWDFVLYTEFVNWPALEAYRIHPLHIEAVSLLQKVRSERAVVDYEL